MATKKDNKFDSAGGVVFVGCMFIGMGLGYFFNQFAVGLFIGMGVGFVGMGLVTLMKK